MGVICRITERVGKSGLRVVTLGAMPQIIPLAIGFQLQGAWDPLLAPSSPPPPSGYGWIIAVLFPTNERGHMPTSVPTVTGTDRARRTTSYWAFCPKCSL